MGTNQKVQVECAAGEKQPEGCSRDVKARSTRKSHLNVKPLLQSQS